MLFRSTSDLKLVTVDDNGNIVKGNNTSIKSKNPMAKLAQEMGVDLPSSNNSNHDDIVDLDTLDVDTESFSHLRKRDKSELNYFLNIPNMPVNLVFMEYMEETLDDMLTGGYSFNEVEWQALIYQVAFGLAVANKQFSFVHNDLHSSNIMVQKTKQPFIYYQIGKMYYKIPSFGRIYKIIDFARATFKLDGKWIFSDVFQDGNDAAEQYDFVPTDGIIPDKSLEPNLSFDLVRLAISLMDRLDDVPRIRDFMTYIATDDNGNMNFMNDDSFQLYIDIAHNCHRAEPIKVVLSKFFNRFITSKEDIPEGMHIFKY